MSWNRTQNEPKKIYNIIKIFSCCAACFIVSRNETNVKRHPANNSSEAPYATLTWNMNEWAMNSNNKNQNLNDSSKRYALITLLSVAFLNDIEEVSVSTYSWDITVLSVSAYVWMCMCVYGRSTRGRIREKMIWKRKENSCEPENLNFMKLEMLKQSQASASATASTSFEQLMPYHSIICLVSFTHAYIHEICTRGKEVTLWAHSNELKMCNAFTCVTLAASHSHICEHTNTYTFPAKCWFAN